jgi:hypothetical protein
MLGQAKKDVVLLKRCLEELQPRRIETDDEENMERIIRQACHDFTALKKRKGLEEEQRTFQIEPTSEPSAWLSYRLLKAQKGAQT